MKILNYLSIIKLIVFAILGAFIFTGQISIPKELFSNNQLLGLFLILFAIVEFKR